MSTKRQRTQKQQKEFTCLVCATTVECTVPAVLTPSCQHPICKDCFAKWLEQLVMRHDFTTVSVKCVMPECPAKYHRSMVAQFLGDSHYPDLQQAIARSEKLHRDPDLKKDCSVANCPGTVSRALTPSSRKAECDTCHRVSCFDCDSDYHGEFSWNPFNYTTAICKTSNAGVVSELQFQSFLNWNARKIKKCPRCHRAIQKAEGCVHMICICGYQFCWRCLAKWRGHGGNCPVELGMLLIGVIVFLIVAALCVVGIYSVIMMLWAGFQSSGDGDWSSSGMRHEIIPSAEQPILKGLTYTTIGLVGILQLVRVRNLISSTQKKD
jgi:hypothetical protein